MSKAQQKNKESRVLFPTFSNLRVREEKKYFIENLTMLLVSGMDIVSALDSINKEIRSPKMRTIITELKKDIDAGVFLWQALDKFKLFSEQIISLIRMGEESGRLAENLKVIIIQQDKDRIFKSKIRSAMMYPILILVVTVVVGVGVAWFILPRLSSIFSRMNLDLPLTTRGLISAGDFLNQYGVIAIPVFVVSLMILVYFIFIFKYSKQLGQGILLSLPGVKKLIQELELARFGYFLGTLLEAGLPIVDALDSLTKVSSFKAYRKLYSYLLDRIKEGNSISNSLSSYPKSKKYIPTSVQTMIYSGEQSGRLPDILIKIGETYEAKTDTTTKDLTVVLEPILLVIVWLGVVGVALAVIMPIYSLIGGLN